MFNDKINSVNNGFFLSIIRVIWYGKSIRIRGDERNECWTKNKKGIKWISKISSGPFI